MRQTKQPSPAIDRAALEPLRDAPETQQLLGALDRQVGGTLEQAADRAARGDTAQLVSAIRAVTQDPENARLLEQLRQKLTQK